jgi:hypothetical protein
MKRRLPLALIVLLPVASVADEVLLKGGGKVSGRIVQRTPTSIEIEVGAGTITVPASRVKKIVEGRSALDDYHDRAGQLAATDVAGWLALGRWASDHGLATQAGEAYARVLATSPADPEANRALGRVQVDGRWMTEEEGHRARGYVQFEGEWMTPAEQQVILAERAAQAEVDRRQAESNARVKEAEARAREAEARAKEAEADAAAAQEAQEGIPLWYVWGPGPNVWPPIVPPTPPRPPPPRPPR